MQLHGPNKSDTRARRFRAIKWRVTKMKDRDSIARMLALEDEILALIDNDRADITRSDLQAIVSGIVLRAANINSNQENKP